MGEYISKPYISDKGLLTKYIKNSCNSLIIIIIII